MNNNNLSRVTQKSMKPFVNKAFFINNFIDQGIYF